MKGLNYLKEDIKTYALPAVIIVIAYFVTHLVFHEFCPSVIIAGVPCPGCGMTRASMRLFTLDFKGAYNYNACIYLVALFAIYFVICRYFLGIKVKWAKQLIAIIVGVMIIYFIFRMATMFELHPKKPYSRYGHPIIYKKENLINDFRKNLK